MFLLVGFVIVSFFLYCFALLCSLIFNFLVSRESNWALEYQFTSDIFKLRQCSSYNSFTLYLQVTHFTFYKKFLIFLCF